MTEQQPEPEEPDFERIVPEEQYEPTLQVGGTVINAPLGSLTEEEAAEAEAGEGPPPEEDEEEEPEE
jgi:hypothetical protein